MVSRIPDICFADPVEFLLKSLLQADRFWTVLGLRREVHRQELALMQWSREPHPITCNGTVTGPRLHIHVQALLTPVSHGDPNVVVCQSDVDRNL